MLNILSWLIGLVTLLFVMIAAIPFLGWANWLLIPIALFGALIGWMAPQNSGRNFCLIVAALSALRLYFGFGLI